jgi:hypothetical protein
MSYCSKLTIRQFNMSRDNNNDSCEKRDWPNHMVNDPSVSILIGYILDKQKYFM